MPFSPSDITGLQGWFDFSDASTLFTDSARTTPVSSDGDPIGGVSDKSGVNNHLGQATSGRKPAYKTNIQNGRSVARFDGTDDLLQSATFTDLTQPSEVFIVAKQDASRDDQIFDGGSGGTKRNTMGFHTGPQDARSFAGTTISAALIDTTQYLLIHTVYDGASGSIGYADYAATAGNIGTDATDGFSLGDGPPFSPSVPLDGDICEVVFYNASLNSTERGNVEAYLNSKWNLYQTSDWFLAGGIAAAHCLAAYAPITAKSFGNAKNDVSRHNQSSTGINEPTWSAGTGWTFDGTNDAMTSSSAVSAATWSVIVRFSGGSGTAASRAIFGSSDLAVGGLQLYPNFTGDLVLAVHGSVVASQGPGITGGVLALTPTGIYLNGSLLVALTANWAGVTAKVNFIGAANDNGSAGEFWSGDIAAIAVYDVDIASQVGDLTTAINALGAPSVGGSYYYQMIRTNP